MRTKFRIFLSYYPFDDDSGEKLRPVLCLTDPVGRDSHVVIAFITSKFPDELEASDLILDPARPEIEGVGLKVPSVLRLHRLFTTDASLLRRNLGQISAPLQEEVKNRLRQFLDL